MRPFIVIVSNIKIYIVAKSILMYMSVLADTHFMSRIVSVCSGQSMPPYLATNI